MTKPPNPLTHGFRAVLHDPAILLAEIAWRWCFGAVAFFLLFGAAMVLMGSVTLSSDDTLAWRSRDPYLVAAALLRLYDAIGGKVLKIAAVVLPVITILWTVLGSAVEISPGLFHFTDPWVTNFPQRFYRLRSP